MKWEVREMSDDRWGVYLQQRYCKTDEPVCYCVGITKDGAQRRVDRLNNPVYDFGLNYVTVKQARETARKKKQEEREAEKKRKAEEREAIRKKKQEEREAEKKRKAEERAEKKRLREEAKKKK